MALKFPDILQSQNPSAYGIVKAVEVSGFKQVANLDNLYNISDAILSESGNNTNDDAIGQEWYVRSEVCKYRLKDWTNRKQASGWEKVTYGEAGDFIEESQKDQPNGVAALNGEGKVSSSVLPLAEALTPGAIKGGTAPMYTDFETYNVVVSDGEASVSLPHAGSVLNKLPVDAGVLTKEDYSKFNNKQDKLVSGTNIKTINGESVLGSGNISISSGSAVADFNAIVYISASQDASKVELSITAKNTVTGTEQPVSKIQLPAVTTSLAGVMIPADKTKLNNITSTFLDQFSNRQILSFTKGSIAQQNANQVNISGGTVTLNNSGNWDFGEDGDNDIVIKAATETEAGVMSATDKVKLDKLVFTEDNKISSNILPSNNISILTQQQYDELEPKDPDVLYIIKD